MNVVTWRKELKISIELSVSFSSTFASWICEYFLFVLYIFMKILRLFSHGGKNQWREKLKLPFYLTSAYGFNFGVYFWIWAIINDWHRQFRLIFLGISVEFWCIFNKRCLNKRNDEFLMQNRRQLMRKRCKFKERSKKDAKYQNWSKNWIYSIIKWCKTIRKWCRKDANHQLVVLKFLINTHSTQIVHNPSFTLVCKTKSQK
jgi:hypothetical protein